jgi:predicted AAA+ superfamily ATPase
MTFPRHAYANLEAPDVRAFAREDPRAFLGQFQGGAMIDEVQRCPELASYLQEKIDADPGPGKWILTGSQNLALLESVSQSLAGRTRVLHLLPLAWNEVLRFKTHPETIDEAILAGGYPRIFDQGLEPAEWLGSYIGTYIERDVRTLSNIGDLTAFQRFVGFCAGRTAQLLNLSSLASDCGISQPTAKAWVSVLEATFVAFRLPSFSRNVNKRLIRMPKLHFHDSGVVCWLLGIRTVDQLRAHPLRGAIFETWTVSEILKHRANQGESSGLSYYRDQHGLEVDLVIETARGLILVEAKAGQTVSGEALGPFERVRAALVSPGQVKSCVVYAGDARQDRSGATILPWREVHGEAWIEGARRARRPRAGHAVRSRNGRARRKRR